MQGNLSLLMLDLAIASHREQIAKAERRYAIAQVSNRASRSRLDGVRQAVSHSLIAVGERTRLSDCEHIAEDLGADHISLNLAR